MTREDQEIEYALAKADDSAGVSCAAPPLFCLRSRVQSNDNWLKYSENLYREEQKRIGAYARECRESLGLSLREVARRMDISVPFLSDLERGNRHWTDGTLTAWENAQRQNAQLSDEPTNHK